MKNSLVQVLKICISSAWCCTCYLETFMYLRYVCGFTTLSRLTTTCFISLRKTTVRRRSSWVAVIVHMVKCILCTNFFTSHHWYYTSFPHMQQKCTVRTKYFIGSVSELIDLFKFSILIFEGQEICYFHDVDSCQKQNSLNYKCRRSSRGSW